VTQQVLKVECRHAGQIGYSLAIQVSRGTMLGPDQPVILHLLDIPPAAQSMDGVKMELIDAALPLVHGAALSPALSPCNSFQPPLGQGQRTCCSVGNAGLQPGSHSGTLCVMRRGTTLQAEYKVPALCVQASV